MSATAILERFHDAILKNDADIAAGDIKANRLGIYIDGYRTRLTQAIRNDYPATLYLLGGKLFDQLALGYIEATPPRSFNLDRYPHGFAAFTNSHPDTFARELTELESTIAQVFMAEESTPLTKTDLQRLTQEQFANLPLRPRAAATLLQFTYPVNGWFDEERAGKKPEAPSQQASYLYVFRHNNEVKRLDISYPAYLLLEQLFSTPSLAYAIETIATAYPQQAAKIMQNVQQWFVVWLDKGVFRIDT